MGIPVINLSFIRLANVRDVVWILVVLGVQPNRAELHSVRAHLVY